MGARARSKLKVVGKAREAARKRYKRQLKKLTALFEA